MDKDKLKEIVVKYKNKIIVGEVGVLVIVFLILVTQVVFDEPTEKDILKQSPYYSEAFFFKGDEKHAALFNDEGKKITDYEFGSYGSFICNNALVTNKDGKKGLINEKGRLVIDYDDYNSIYEAGGLYVVKEDGKSKLLDCEGDFVKDLKNLTVYRDSVPSTSVLIYDKDTLYIYGYKGKVIAKLPFKDKDDVVVNEFGDYTIVNSYGNSVLYNSITGKIVNEFENKKSYCINGVDEDGTLFSLYSCSNDYKKDDVSFLVVTKEEVKDVSKTCDSLLIQYNMLNCVSDNETSVLNSNFKRAFNYYDGTIAYVDGDNYAKVDGDNLVITRKGKEERTIKLKGYNLRSSKVDGESFLVNKKNNYVFYDLKGKEMFSIKADSVSPFTNLGVAFVSNDSKVYLINKNGKKVTEEYDNIYNDGDYLEVKNGKKIGLIDVRDKLLIDIDYEDIIKNEVRGSIYYTLNKKGKYSIYSVDEKKIIMENVDDVNYYDHYFVVSKKNKDYYYTYNVEEFFSK